MKKRMAENKWKLIVSSVLILLPQVIAWGTGENLYYLPLQCLAMHWLCILVTFYDWRKREQGKTAVSLTVWIVPVLSVAGSAFLMLAKHGKSGGALSAYLVYIGLGVMFIVLGNYFPKIRQNRTLGIKVKWALEDEDNWNATHRFGGKVWVACGFLCLFGALFPFDGPGVVLLLAAIVIPTVYSWRYFRIKLRKGEAVKQPLSRKRALSTGLFTAAVAAFLVWAMLMGDFTIRFQEDGFAVDASGWSDYRVKYEDVESLSYEPDGLSDSTNGRRTNGLGNLKVAMGNFYNDRFGDYIRYTFNGCKDCVVLQVGQAAVVLNGRDREATKELYDTLKGKIR